MPVTMNTSGLAGQPIGAGGRLRSVAVAAGDRTHRQQDPAGAQPIALIEVSVRLRRRVG
jgi:hypothetical protein